MNKNNSNIIYVDFHFKRKKITSKSSLIIYRLYTKLICLSRIFNNNPSKSNKISDNLFNIRKSS